MTLNNIAAASFISNRDDVSDAAGAAEHRPTSPAAECPPLARHRAAGSVRSG